MTDGSAGAVEVRIGKPIPLATIARLRPDALAVLVRAAISELADMPLREVAASKRR